MSLQFPNVPQLPGVPPVVRALGGYVTLATAAFTAISHILSQASQVANIWGVFDADNNLVLAPDSIREFDVRAEWRVSNYPVQQGSFATYDKVTMPAEYSVRMAKGGSVDERQAFQSQVEAVAASTNLFTIVTPEESYSNVNVTRYEISRKEAAGAFFLVIDLFFIQIIEVAAQYSTTANTPDLSNAKDASAIPNAPQGTVQAQPVSSTGIATALSTVGIP
jgi:hypothetical protein